MNIPTVDDLVKIFKDNNWTPQQMNGATIENVLNGRCCGIPAVVKFIDPNYDFEKADSQDLYDLVGKTYGNLEKESLYFGFDGCPECNYLNKQFYNLGKELYQKLTSYHL